MEILGFGLFLRIVADFLIIILFRMHTFKNQALFWGRLSVGALMLAISGCTHHGALGDVVDLVVGLLLLFILYK